MKPSLLSRLFFGLLGAAVLLLHSGPATAQDDVDPRLEKVLADWQKRRERIKSIHYWVEGERILPKGSFTDSRGLPLKPEEPPRDIVLPIKWSLLLDFPTQRHRFEVDEKGYDRKTGQLYPASVWTNMFDGSVMRWKAPRQANVLPGQQADPTTPDAGVYTGDLRGASFQPRHRPFFLGVGIIVLPGELVYPGHLSPELDSLWFRIHGQGVHDGRSCLVVRGQKRRSGPYQDFWVDTGRDSSIVRFVQGLDGLPQFVMDLDYQKTKHGWLLQGWTYNEYASKDRVSCMERMRVKRLEVNSSVSDSAFQVDVEPGMLVRKMHMEQAEGAPRGVIKPKETEYFRVDEDGDLTEVGFKDGVEYKKWPWWSWWLAGLLSLAAVSLLWLYVRRRKRAAGRT